MSSEAKQAVTFPADLLEPYLQPPTPDLILNPDVLSYIGCEICPRMNWMIDNGGRRIYQLGSLDRKNVLESFLPNSIAVVDRKGQLWKTGHTQYNGHDTGLLMLEGPKYDDRQPIGETQMDGSGEWFMTKFDYQAADFIQAGWIVPVGPWGDAWDVMFTDLSEYSFFALNDLPDNILGPALERQAALIRKFAREDYPVNWGVCNSAGTLHGQGLMSILYPHSHTWQFSHELHDEVNLTPENIITARNRSNWDGGLSRLLGEYVKVEFGPDLQTCCPNASDVLPDNMGFTFLISGFQPEDFNLDFFRMVWTSLSLKIDEQLRAWFARNYLSPDRQREGNLGQVYEFVRQAHLAGEADEEIYQGFFRYRNPSSQDRKEGLLLDKLETTNLVRYPPGWAAAIQFTPNGAFFTVSFGFLNVPLGGVESLAIRLMRPEEKLTGEALNRKMKFFADEILPVIYG